MVNKVEYDLTLVELQIHGHCLLNREASGMATTGVDWGFLYSLHVLHSLTVDFS